MANMSHCRFHNTVGDLRDCYEHMDDKDVSDEEYRERQRLIRLCVQIADDYADELESK